MAERETEDVYPDDDPPAQYDADPLPTAVEMRGLAREWSDLEQDARKAERIDF